jgi:hypothetical protein
MNLYEKIYYTELSEIGKGFCEACINDNSTDELIEGLLQTEPDKTDLENWEGLSEDDYRLAMAAALSYKIEKLNDQIEELEEG